ncbi:hypothetical protein NMG60_11016495 [Bertholletia excelsa]
MYRPALAPLRYYHHQPQRWQEAWARLLAPLTLWICVSVTLRYGYYGNCRMVLGPSSSRLFEASSVFVKQVEVTDEDRRGVFLYLFSEKPELSLERNWSVSNYVIVAAYSRRGFSLWLNKGSSIRLRWEAQTSGLTQLQVSLIKGERKFETLEPISTRSPYAHHSLIEPTDGREAEYVIQEDDKYYIRITNTNPRSLILVMNLNVSSKMHDTSKARGICSTVNGSCRLNLLFASHQFVVVTTPENGHLEEWYIELSFMSRLISYVGILGFVVIFILLILRHFGAFDGNSSETHQEALPAVQQATEADPLMPEKLFRSPYGTGEVDPECGSSCPSEDLYDGKICAICYEEPRNCFFVPCGHCATCYACAQRIMNGETRTCPICRRLIHKVGKLLIP